jgi:hypothetical protein
MSILDRFRKKAVVTETTEVTFGKITQEDVFGGGAANEELEKIFTGQNHDYDLAAGPFNKQILTVARLVGVPILPAKCERIQRLLLDEYPIIVLRALINGTHWVFPQWDNESGSIALEHIKDSTIGGDGLRLDPITKKIRAVVIREQIRYIPDSKNFLGFQDLVQRERIITSENILERIAGRRNESREYRNPFGFMPIGFAYNSLGEWRGTSVYSGVLRLLRDNHSIRRNRDEILARFKPKAMIKSQTVDQWVQRNQKQNRQSSDRYDPFAADVVTNSPSEEFNYVSLPSNVAADHTAALEDNNKEILISSMLPEIFSGRMATGNYASSEFQHEQGIAAIKAIRRELTKATKALINQLEAIDAHIHWREARELEVEWDNLQLASPLTQSQTLTNVVGAVVQMVSRGVPPEVGFNLLKGIMPAMPYETSGELLAGMVKMQEEVSAHVNEPLFGLQDVV